MIIYLGVCLGTLYNLGALNKETVQNAPPHHNFPESICFACGSEHCHLVFVLESLHTRRPRRGGASCPLPASFPLGVSPDNHLPIAACMVAHGS